MLKFFLGVPVGGVLAVTAPLAAQGFAHIADVLPDSVIGALYERFGVGHTLRLLSGERPKGSIKPEVDRLRDQPTPPQYPEGVVIDNIIERADEYRHAS